jgi:DNA polymerase I-like protein with 3'-5' exonuclease and polymerase domains
VFFDTETTSLDFTQAELVWISIYLNDENIFYINFWHNWDKVSRAKLKDFIKYLFSLDIEIIGHNLKYDLEIIDIFLKTDCLTKSQFKNKWSSWQMTLDL